MTCTYIVSFCECFHFDCTMNKHFECGVKQKWFIGSSYSFSACVSTLGHTAICLSKSPSSPISCLSPAVCMQFFFLMSPPHLVEICDDCDPVSLNEASTLGLTCSSFYHLATYVPGSGPFQSSNHPTNCLLLWSLAGSPRFSSNSPLTLFIPHIVSVHVSQA